MPEINLRSENPMKKILSIISSTAIILGISSCGYAAENTSADFTMTMQIDNPVMTINGAEKNIDENGTVPVIIDGRTLLPVRAFVEGIGGTVEWDENAKTATLAYNAYGAKGTYRMSGTHRFENKNGEWISINDPNR